MPEQTEQVFIDSNNLKWQELKEFPGAQLLPLAQPVPQGSIHRLKMVAGTVIPVHYHPCNEYIYVLDGIIETTGHQCKAGTFWSTPANVKNSLHKAITDVEIITIRLGAMGVFEE
jgi:quercetin dioxygenase-like cupin family protein